VKRKKPEKAYKNLEFLASREARTLRILSEYLEPEKRFHELDIRHTVVFFGSARSGPKKDAHGTEKYYRAAEELAYRLATFSNQIKDKANGFNICTGGGPGIMEAANRGARRAKSRTIGLNISLPFEQHPNTYINPELNFEFHYFFMRKLWFLYHAKALVVFPGGFGTMDELFETLTLVQTGKLEKGNLPILLYDRGYWESIINFKKMAEMGFISHEDLKLFHFCDTPEEGFDFLKSRIERLITRVTHNVLEE
jgi:uncharacterized protein (TIGR00730 family)